AAPAPAGSPPGPRRGRPAAPPGRAAPPPGRHGNDGAASWGRAPRSRHDSRGGLVPPALNDLDSERARRHRPAMEIDCEFDGGAVEVIRAERAGDIELAIRHDTKARDFRQWFAFRVRGLRGREARVALANAGECTYPDAFEGYSAVASYDRKRWFRVPTS